MRADDGAVGEGAIDLGVGQPGRALREPPLRRLVLLRLHRAEPGDDGGGIGRHRCGQALRTQPPRDERIGSCRHQWIFTRTSTSAGGSGSMVTNAGSPASAAADRDPLPGRVWPGERTGGSAGFGGVHHDEKLVSEPRQLAGDHDLAAAAASPFGLTTHRFVGVEDARPGDHSRSGKREIAEDAGGALVLASGPQHGCRPASRRVRAIRR